MIVGLAIAWSLFSQKSQLGLHEPITSLDLDPTGARARANALGLAEIAPSPPKTPQQWDALFSLPRPRDIYIPMSSKLGLIVEVIAFAAGIWFAIFSITKGRPDWKHVGGSLFFVAWLLLLASGEIASIRRELLARSLLRDGEVATGLIVDWRSGRHSINLEYQFWTNTGKRFEHSGKVVSDTKLYEEKGLVPIFYMAEDPTKSVALCSTRSRIRILGGQSFGGS